MNHENCHELLDSLSDFIDGELGPDLCTKIERHLEGCENCRIVVDSLRKTVSLYHETSEETPAVPDEVRQRLFRVLDLDEVVEGDLIEH